MEREKEIAKLMNVLRRTSRMALHLEWTGGNEDSAGFCVEQYNRVLARLRQLDEAVGTVFDPLPAGSSLTVAAMACRQLAAYYEDEVGVGTRGGSGWAKAYGMRLDPETFKEFWQKSAREIEDLGEFIRESIEEWVRQRKGKDKGEGGACS